MQLSENQELVQKLKQILEDYPALEYDAHGSAHLDNTLMVKVSADVKYDISDTTDVARKLSESTGDNYIPRLSANPDGSTLDDLRSFKLLLPKPHRNIRITYPDSRDGKLEVDVVQGVAMSLNIDMNDPQFWSFAEGNELEIQFNIFALPNYRKYLRSQVTKITRTYNESTDSNHLSNSELKKIIDDDTDSRD